MKLITKIKYAFQRMSRGYDDDEVFDFENRFIERTLNILQKVHSDATFYCYPSSKVSSFDEWRWKIRLMCYHLEHMQDRFYSNTADGKHSLSFTEISREKEKHKNEFFKLFNEYFYDLWI